MPAVLAALALLALGGPAAQSADAAYFGEPEYTKGTSNTTWHQHVQFGGPGTQQYCYEYRVNNMGSYFNQGCSAAFDQASPTTNVKVGTLNGLASGSFYYHVATTFISGTFYPCSGSASGCATSTTMDASAPQATTFVEGTAQYTRDSIINVHIDYADSISPPWPGPNGVASTFGCLKREGACSNSDTFTYDPGCSVPNFYRNRINSHDCTYDFSSYPDGPIHYCAVVADSAFPDNPSSGNQLGATSNQANLSGIACGGVILDRSAPAVTASASATTVTVGQLVNFTAGATDDRSGVSGNYNWTFGDNTANATGATPSHTYTQPGTYVARVTSTDGAGNEGAGTVTIQVNPASTGNTTTGGGSTGGNVTITQTPPTSNQISQQVGGGGTQTQTVGGLEVLAPKKVKITKKLKKLPIALTPSVPGDARLSLVRKRKVVVDSSATFSEARTFGVEMKLPRRVKPGIYSLKVSFTPQGAAEAIAKTLKIKFTRPKARRSSVRVSAKNSRPRLVGGVRGIARPRGGRAAPARARAGTLEIR